MDWQPPPRPRWVDRLNGHADHAGHARLLVPLVGLVADMPGADLVKSKKLNRRSGVFSMYSLEKFVEAATEEAGLDDFGRPGEFGDSGAGGRCTATAATSPPSASS